MYPARPEIRDDGAVDHPSRDGVREPVCIVAAHVRRLSVMNAVACRSREM
jgi:hypothetical protein